LPHVVRSHAVPYLPAEMFSLVADVERYPEFLPWCASVRLHWKTEEAAEAEFAVGHGLLGTSFTAKATFRGPEEIELELVRGLFSSFGGTWRFEPLAGRGTNIRLDLHFEFGKRAGTLIRLLFGKAADKLVTAFEQRAAALYGPRHAANA
jgi:ribosome-associated toxin RatA of RatAB toxin-antitoxin module